MPRDIRSYFTSAAATKTESNSSSSKPKRRRVISSDEDEVQVLSPLKRPKKTKSGKHALSESDDEKQKKTMSPADIFGKKPIERKEARKIPKQQQRKEAKAHGDDDFEATLSQLDTSEIEEKYLTECDLGKDSANDKEVQNDTPEVNTHNKKEKKTPVKNKNEVEEIKLSESSNLGSGDKKHVQKRKQSSSSNEDAQQDHNDHVKGKSKQAKQSPKSKTSTSKIDIEIKHTKKKVSPQKAEPDIYEQRIEKKKNSAALYQQYLHRGGARNPGSKEVPEGAEYCLAKLSFLITGVLDSLEREEAEELIKKYGGRILQSVSKKTDYVIVGDQPGPSKLAKASSLNIKQISEDDLLEMIRSRPAGKADDIQPTKAKSKDRMKHNSTESVEKSPSPTRKLNISAKEEEDKPINIRSPSKSEQNEKDAEKSTKARSPVKKRKIASILDNEIKSSDTQDRKIKTDTLQDINGNVSVEALVEKYRPKTMKQILGQQGDKSNAKKLYTWLSNWHKNQSGHVKLARPSQWAKNDDGAFFKAALLSGPPGIGKTTTVQVVCKELGFDLVEFNASDTRSKKLLKEEVSELLNNTSLKDYFTENKHKTSVKHALLMDEVDGMAGNEDRGGLQELISLIKSSDVPIICICNDRNNPKMRTLSNYTFDLRFPKPRLEQIRGAMKSICFKENIDISTEDLDRLIESTNQDIRQVINHLALFVGKAGQQEKTEKKHVNKDLKLGPWDVLKQVFSAEDHKRMNIHDKSGLFFHDYSIAPLFVQENYLVVAPQAPKSELLERVAQSAESLALGDIVEKSIRSNGAWSLLPMQACYSSVIPGTVMSGHITGQINFPAWLGRNSKTNKFNRLLQEITVHARLATGVSKEAINLDYIKPLRDGIVSPLAEHHTEGVDSSIEVMKHYHLLREDLDGLIELSLWPGGRDPLQAVDSKVKAAFTRAYNKHCSAVPYTMGTSKKKGAQASQNEDFIVDEEEEGNDENSDEDNVESDKMIKAKKPTVSKKTEPKGKSDKGEPKSKSTDKPAKRGRGRGRGK